MRKTCLPLVSVLLSALAFGTLAAQEFHFTGGAVEGTQLRTNMETALYNTLDPANGASHILLAGSNLTVHVDAGDSDLFVYEIDAECSLPSFDAGDFVQVQARLNGFVRPILGGPAFLQPQSVPTDLEFCGAPWRHSVAKSWAVRLSGEDSGADYTFTIWWRAFDAYASGTLLARLDNRTVRITRYN